MTRNFISTKPRGFTLIELLVVIAIIGLLSSVILTSLNVAREKGNDATRKTNLTEIQKALQSYYDDNGRYPGPTNGVYPASCTGGSGNCVTLSQCHDLGNIPDANDVIPGLVSGGYISQLPTDGEMNTATDNCCYIYIVNSTGSDYKYLFAKGSSPAGACAMSAAGTSGGPIDPARPNNAWAVYTPSASGY